jgi:hypothetical protein
LSLSVSGGTTTTTTTTTPTPTTTININITTTAMATAKGTIATTKTVAKGAPGKAASEQPTPSKRHGSTLARSGPWTNTTSRWDLSSIISERFTQQCGPLASSLFEYTKNIQLDPNNNKYLIWRCSAWQAWCGGLGDRLKGIAGAFLLALVLGRKFAMAHPPVSQFDRYFETPEGLAGLGVYWKFVPSRGKRAPTEEVIIMRTNMKKGWLTEDDLMHSKNGVDNIYLHSHVFTLQEIQSNKHLRPALARLALPQNQDLMRGCLLNWLIWPSKRLRSAIEQPLAALRCKGCVIIAIHIRVGGRGGSGSTSWTDPSRVPANRTGDFFHCAKVIERTLSKRTDGATVKWFVTSDSDKVLAEGRARGGARVVENTGELIHVDISRVTDTGLQRMYADFELLTEADILIGSPSGFSGYASQIAFLPKLTWPHFTRKDYAQCASAALRL